MEIHSSAVPINAIAGKFIGIHIHPIAIQVNLGLWSFGVHRRSLPLRAIVYHCKTGA
jgi:hypothetical protein